MVELLDWEPQGGTPLLCCINNRVCTVPFHGQCHLGVSREWVVPKDRFVLDYGLFPASDPTALVLLESSRSPLGYGLRCMLRRELGDLWYVPILLLLDSLLDTEVMTLMGGICQSPPLKLLHTGADLLLTTGFQGGFEGRGTESTKESLELPGPCPLSDEGLGLKRGSSLKQSCSPDISELDWFDSVVEEIIKEDSQKAGDDVAVLDHLWLRAFVIGYGDMEYQSRHLAALNLSIDNVSFLGNPKQPVDLRGALLGI